MNWYGPLSLVCLWVVFITVLVRVNRRVVPTPKQSRSVSPTGRPPVPTAPTGTTSSPFADRRVVVTVPYKRGCPGCGSNFAGTHYYPVFNDRGNPGLCPYEATS